MKIDVSSALTIVIGLITVIGAIYKLAQVESNINLRISRIDANTLVLIDAVKDDLVDRINAINTKLEIHKTEYKSDKEYIYEYRLNATEKTIEHKFNRLANWITQIAGFLNKKTGFQILDDKY